MNDDVELRLLRAVPMNTEHTILKCDHGYTFCLGEAIPPGERRGRGLQLYDDKHYTGTIGFMEIAPRRDLNLLYINLLGVEPEYRGQHHSSAMVRWAVRATQAIGLAAVEIPDVIGMPDGNLKDYESRSRLERALLHAGFARTGKHDWRREIRREEPRLEAEERI